VGGKDLVFEETIRALRAIDGKHTVSIPIGDDEEGYFDRECPREDCLFQFKVLTEDWKAVVRDEEVFCPNCGHSADSSKWWTAEQIAHAKKAAAAQIRSRISGALRRDATRFNARQRPGGFLSMSMKVDSKPQSLLLPPAAVAPMRLKIACSACSCRYAVVGSAYFCPACGHNAADQQFLLTIEGIRQAMASLDTVRAAIPDADIAEQTARLLVEHGIISLVTSFQRCAEALYAALPSVESVRRNAFQNLDEGDRIWKAATGHSYSDHLEEDELGSLRIIFQQRHLLAHTQGMVDADYVTKSGDQRYSVGQRLVIRSPDTLGAAIIVEKLGRGLMNDVG
jgi:uncharacterized Zn finger protein (UPF0148 family)